MLRLAKDEYGLWQSFKKGDKKSFQNIYHNHFHHLFEYGIRLIQDKELVKDVIQDLFVKLWNNKANLGDVTAIRSYLMVSLRGAIFNKLEKEKRINTTEVEEDTPFEMEFSVESDYIKKETDSLNAQKLIEALNKLTPRQKEVLYLRFYEEMDYEDVASVMNITVKATYKLHARGLEMLRNIMGITEAAILIFLGLVRLV